MARMAKSDVMPHPLEYGCLDIASGRLVFWARDDVDEASDGGGEPNGR